MITDMSQHQGHTANGPPSLNTAGYAYTTFITIYSILILVGLSIIWCNRRETIVRLHGVVLTTVTVLTLHVYLAALFVVYPLNGLFKCSTEFWYMSIIFPFGIAFFQASNAKLLSVAKAQYDSYYYKKWSLKRAKFGFSPGQSLAWFLGLDYHERTYVCIGLGLVVQVWYTSRSINLMWS